MRVRLLVGLVCCVGLASCQKRPDASRIDSKPESSVSAAEAELLPRDPPTVQPTIQPYALRPDLSNVVNLDDFRFTDQQKALLVKNHLLIFDADVTNPVLVYLQTPVPFVTSDILLHVLHVLSTDSLQRVEQHVLRPTLTTFGTPTFARTS